MKDVKQFPNRFDPFRPPVHLSEESRQWWEWIIDEYELDEGSAPILQAALEARDRAAEARKILGKEGMTVLDRFEQTKAHPCIAIERDSLGLLVRSWRALGLGEEPPRPVGRPPAT